jgi:hypothetical protein
LCQATHRIIILGRIWKTVCNQWVYQLLCGFSVRVIKENSDDIKRQTNKYRTTYRITSINQQKKPDIDREPSETLAFVCHRIFLVGADKTKRVFQFSCVPWQSTTLFYYPVSSSNRQNYSVFPCGSSCHRENTWHTKKK